MKAVVFQGPLKLAVKNVEDPKIEQPGDTVIRITTARRAGRVPARPHHPRPGCAVAVNSHELPLGDPVRGYHQFDKRADGWAKVILHL